MMSVFEEYMEVCTYDEQFTIHHAYISDGKSSLRHQEVV